MKCLLSKIWKTIAVIAFGFLVYVALNYYNQVNERFNIALTAPMSLTTSFGKSDGAWNQSALSMGLFSENNLIVLTYAFEKRVRK